MKPIERNVVAQAPGNRNRNIPSPSHIGALHARKRAIIFVSNAPSYAGRPDSTTKLYTKSAPLLRPHAVLTLNALR